MPLRGKGIKRQVVISVSLSGQLISFSLVVAKVSAIISAMKETTFVVISSDFKVILIVIVS